MGKSMDWTMKNNTVKVGFLHRTPKLQNGPYTLFVKAGVETSDISAEAGKPEPHSSWLSYSRRAGVDVRDKGKASRSPFRSLRLPSLIGRQCRTHVVVVR